MCVCVCVCVMYSYCVYLCVLNMMCLSSPQCMLVNSGLKDHIYIHTDDTGAVMGVSLSTNTSHCRNSEQQVVIVRS